MIVTGVATYETQWELIGGVGDTLRLPRARSSDRPFLIGTVGTRRRVELKGNLTARFAGALAELQQPIILVDVRRTGMGGSGSWGPAEFSTVIPAFLKEVNIAEYSFHHIPILSPSLPLLDAWRRAAKGADTLSEEQVEAAVQQVLAGEQPPQAAWKHWQVFRAAYHRELSSSGAVPAARALVEAAYERRGIAIFLCAEERRDDFQRLSRQERDDCYCHRFTLANEVARSIQRDFPDSEVWRVDLAVGEPLKRKRLAVAD